MRDTNSEEMYKLYCRIKEDGFMSLVKIIVNKADTSNDEIRKVVDSFITASQWFMDHAEEYDARRMICFAMEILQMTEKDLAESCAANPTVSEDDDDDDDQYM